MRFDSSTGVPKSIEITLSSYIFIVVLIQKNQTILVFFSRKGKWSVPVWFYNFSPGEVTAFR